MPIVSKMVISGLIRKEIGESHLENSDRKIRKMWTCMF